MAEGKKSFTAYCDWKDTFDSLPDDKAGQLIKHLFAYVNDENPNTDDILIKAVFAQIKATLKRDLKKWEAKREQNKANALKRWNKNDANVCERIKRNANDAVSVSVSDRDIDTTTKEAEVDFFKVDEWIKEIGKSQVYLEGLYRTHKLYKGSISELLNNFKEHLKIYPKAHNNFSDFKKHFASWLNVKISKGEMSKYLKNTKGQL